VTSRRFQLDPRQSCSSAISGSTASIRFVGFLNPCNCPCVSSQSKQKCVTPWRRSVFVSRQLHFGPSWTQRQGQAKSISSFSLTCQVDEQVKNLGREYRRGCYGKYRSSHLSSTLANFARSAEACSRLCLHNQRNGSGHNRGLTIDSALLDAAKTRQTYFCKQWSFNFLETGITVPTHNDFHVTLDGVLIHVLNNIIHAHFVEASPA
jgi:hypothetical protein